MHSIEKIAFHAASALQLPIHSTAKSTAICIDNDWQITIDQKGIWLSNPKKTSPLYISLNNIKNHYFKKNIAQQSCLLARAIGLTTNKNIEILDATAGLGQDAFQLMCLKARVTLIEQSPIIAYLLAYTIQEACLSGLWDSTAPLIFQGMAEMLIPDLSNKIKFDVIYLDPMFPIKNKKSLNKKTMQTLQAFIKPVADNYDLLKIAKQHSSLVVIKRPRNANYYANSKASYSLFGKIIRFDIYRS